jgi:ubiquitin C
MAWQIKIKDLQGKEYIINSSSGNTTLSQLKAGLQDKSGILSCQQRLVYDKEILPDDEKTLSQYGISNGSCLQIVVLSGWVIRIADRHNPGRVLEVLIEGLEPQTKTVQYMKQQIVKRQGESVMKLHEIRLIKNSQDLSDHATLQESGLINGDTIQMKKRSFPPWTIFIKGLTGKTHTMVVARNNPEETTISQLKTIVQDKTGLKPEEQRLCFGSKPLEDHHRFEDLNICNNSTLFLVVRMRGGPGGHEDMVDLLKASPTSTIDKIPNCPIFRACPSCGTLLEHTQGCRNFNCWSCKLHFCFICLSLGQSGSLTCGSNCKVADRQTAIPGNV